MKRTFMVGDLRNFYSRVDRLPDAIKEAEPFELDVIGDVNALRAREVAEAFAEKFHSDREYPSDYDLVIWEMRETENGELIPPRQVFRVTIQVRYTPEFYDSHGVPLDVSAPAEVPS